MRQFDWPSRVGLPPKQGLYDPANEHENCGMGFIADIKNRKSHDIVCQGIQILINLDHRGAIGADPMCGDGAGILTQIPDALFREDVQNLGYDLPAQGNYAVGMVFLPRGNQEMNVCIEAIEQTVHIEGQTVIGWRDVPVNKQWLGETVKPIEPVIRQIFIKRGENCPNTDAFERKLYVIRKQAHHLVWDADLENIAQFYIPSMSARTVC